MASHSSQNNSGPSCRTQNPSLCGRMERVNHLQYFNEFFTLKEFRSIYIQERLPQELPSTLNCTKCNSTKPSIRKEWRTAEAEDLYKPTPSPKTLEDHFTFSSPSTRTQTIPPSHFYPSHLFHSEEKKRSLITRTRA